MVTYSSEQLRLIEIGKQYGAYVLGSGTVLQLNQALWLGNNITTRLQAVGGNTSWSLEQLEQAERLNAVPQMPTISVNNITDNSASVNWTPYQYDKPTVTSFHFVLKDEDTGQTITENDFMSGARNSYESNLDSGTNYKGYLIAINAIGNSSENSIAFKTTGIKVVIPPVITPPVVVPPVIVLSAEVQAILTKFDNNDYTFPSWFNSNIGYVKDGSITSNEFLAALNNLLQAGTIIDKTIPVEKEYDVNTYRINEFGGTFNLIIKGIDGNKLLELEKEFLVTLVGKPTPSDQEIYDFYNFVDTSIPFNSIIQKIGAFTLKDGRLKGRIDYKTTEEFNAYYYNKLIYSVVNIRDQYGADILSTPKVNNLNFTAQENTEYTIIDENVGDINAVKIQFHISKNANTTLPFSQAIDTEIVCMDCFPPCQIGQHRNFNGKCVADDQSPVGGKPTVIALLGGVTALIGTLALLGSKRS